MKKRMRNVLIIICIALCALAVLAALLWPKKTAVQAGNLLKNGDFQQLNNAGLPEDWFTDAYINTVGYSTYSAQAGVATIVNNAPNDARFAQEVSVQPDSLYCLSGRLRADASEGWGANLSLKDITVHSESVYDSDGEWKEVRLYGRTGKDQHSVTVYARLGGYSGEAFGTASFQALSLEQVESIPSNYVAYPWYPVELPSVDFDEPSPAWPWLLAIAAAYAALCFAAAKWVLADRGAAGRRSGWLSAAAILALAACARLAVALLIPGYGVDIGCFSAWAEMMVQNGPANFYNQAGFCDYPPGYLLILWGIGGLGRLLSTVSLELLVKLPSICCDIAAAALLYGFARRRIPQAAALALMALYAVNPLTFAAGAAWGQADSVMALCLMLTLIFALEQKWMWALPVYTLSVLLKPQALMFGPLGLAALVIELVRQRQNRRLLLQAALGVGLSLLAILAVVTPFSVHMESPLWLVRLYRDTMGYYSDATVNACNLYFVFGKNWVGVEQPIAWTIRLCGVLCVTAGVACAAARLRGLGRGKEDVRTLILLAVSLLAGVLLTALPMNYSTYGACMIVWILALNGALYWAGGSLKHLPLLGAVTLILLCNLGVMMHERYIFAAALLLAMASALERDVRVYALFALVSVSAFLNVGIVLDRGIRIGGASGHLTAPAFGITSESTALEYLLAAANCALSAWAGSVAVAVCWQGETVAYRAKEASAGAQPQTGTARPDAAWRAEKGFSPAPIPPMKRLDWLLMLGITALYAVAAFVNLGATKSPQTYWRAETAEEKVVLDLGQERAFNMLYFGGIHENSNDFIVRTSDDGVTWGEYHWAQLDYGDCFKWQYVCVVNGTDGNSSYTSTPLLLQGRYVQIESRTFATTLYEVILRDPETKEVFPVSVYEGNGGALVDEQDAFTGEPNWYNSTYFDEIYHARTGYEHYLAMHGDYTYRPYEVSHPPLGKVLIAVAISIFGMTPFGWRFAGALAGVLMLPGMYLLGKLVTKRRLYAFAAMFLMAVDCMHFTQTRIATIDSFAVLFIIWSYVFMIYYLRMDYWRTRFWKTLLPLLFSGIFMGLSIASKWTGCYAGAGLAVLFFWSAYRRLRECRYAQDCLQGEGNGKKKEKQRVYAQPYHTAAGQGMKRLLLTLCACVVFFVLIPAGIYYLSYIPYFLPSGGVTVKKVIQAAEYMFNYHYTPGFGMDHPYYSPWYEWPVIGKPMWYFSSTYRPANGSQTIMAFGNPAVWWTGLAALFAVAAIWAARHVSRRGLSLYDRTNDMRPAILIISFAAQYLPWLLVPRGTYIYHYFPSVPFIILCIALCLDLLGDAAAQPALLPAWHARLALRWNRFFTHTEDEALRERAQRTVAVRWRSLPSVLTALYLLLALGLFIGFFPYASGITASYRWLQAMQWLKGLYF